MAYFQQKKHFGYILEGLEMKDVGIFYGQLVYFYGHLVYLIAICNILWLFGTFFSTFLYVLPRKVWQP
jgi:hypothetical protein